MENLHAVLEAEDLVLGYGGRPLLEGVWLRVLRGQFWCFLGPNGAGKTTLLRSILGLLKPLSGSLRLRLERGGRQGIGFVPQRHEINAVLPTTVREFVLLGMFGLRLGRREKRAWLSAALARAGLDGMGSVDFGSLSGGQRQRALLARALVRSPSLLILDEPTEGLDISIEEALLSFLAELNRSEGLTLLVVTHDLSIARTRASHVALFGGGRVLAGGREEVLTEKNLRRAYPGDVAATGAGSAAEGGRA